MKRREFIKVVCGLIGAWPIAAYAQQVSRPRRIGVLGSNATIWKPWAAAFVARLQETLLRSSIAGPREAPSASVKLLLNSCAKTPTD